MRWDALEDGLREKVDEYWKIAEKIFSGTPDEFGVTVGIFYII